MGFWIAIGVTAIALAGFFLIKNTLNSGGKFWRLAGAHPDLTLRLLANESDVVVDQEPPAQSRSNYTGPFTLFDGNGRAHRIYIVFAQIDAVQRRITNEIKNQPTGSSQDF